MVNIYCRLQGIYLNSYVKSFKIKLASIYCFSHFDDILCMTESRSRMLFIAYWSAYVFVYAMLGKWLIYDVIDLFSICLRYGLENLYSVHACKHNRLEWKWSQSVIMDYEIQLVPVSNRSLNTKQNSDHVRLGQKISHARQRGDWGAQKTPKAGSRHICWFRACFG